MAAERLSMQKIKEALRLRHLGLSTRRIAASLQIGRTTVGDYLARAKAANISWPLPPELGENELINRLFVSRSEQRRGRPLPDWSHIHAELRRKHVNVLADLAIKNFVEMRDKTGSRMFLAKKRLEKSNKEFGKYLKTKTEKLAKTRAAYLEVIKMRVAHWAIAAAARVGQLFQNFADALYTALKMHATRRPECRARIPKNQTASPSACSTSFPTDYFLTRSSDIAAAGIRVECPPSSAPVPLSSALA